MEWEEKRSAEKVLGLGNSYSLEDVEKAYRSLVKKNHPDLGGDQEAMMEINRAKDFMDRLFRREPKGKRFASSADDRDRSAARERSGGYSEEFMRAADAYRSEWGHGADSPVATVDDAHYDRSSDSPFADAHYKSPNAPDPASTAENYHEADIASGRSAGEPLVHKNSSFHAFCREASGHDGLWRAGYAAACFIVGLAFMVSWSSPEPFIPDMLMLFVSVTLPLNLLTGFVTLIPRKIFGFIADVTDVEN